MLQHAGFVLLSVARIQTSLEANQLRRIPEVRGGPPGVVSVSSLQKESWYSGSSWVLPCLA